MPASPSPILTTLTQLYDTRGDEVERWLTAQRTIAQPFFSTSVDLRHSGLRLAPVDTNLFPAGFQNLSPAACARASRLIARYMAEHHPTAQRLLIIPESHTRNLPYLDNLATLLTLFHEAGFEARIGSLTAQEQQPLELISARGAAVQQFPLVRHGDLLQLADGYIPDILIINNDMTAGIPPLLEGLRQPMTPPPYMGWFQRQKSTHFQHYQALAEDFGRTFDIDPWLISAYSHRCGIVDFKDKTSLDQLAQAVDDILARAREKHAAYGISAAPYVYVKADSGTYGMGIMTAHSGDEMRELNKKERNKMQVIKEGARVSDVIIQEGIPTTDMVEGAPAEPMVYMIDGIPVGGMYRVNDQRDTLGNLNATGMRYTGMCDETEDECGQWKKMPGCHFRSHGIIAALAALAAGRESYPHAA